LNNGQSYTRAENITIPATAQGQYFVIVATDANGEEDECANNGNNSGTGNVPVVINNSLPDLVVQSADLQSNFVGGQTVNINWTVANNGTIVANNPAWGDAIYFSSDQTLSGDDRRLTTAPAAGPLAAAGTYDRQAPITLPVMPPGNYYLIVQTDYLDNVFEGQGENNNTRSLALPVDVPAVDLTVTSVDVPESAFSGQNMTVSWTVANQGSGPTIASSLVDEIVLSLDQIDDPSDRVIGAKRHDGVIGGGAGYSESLQIVVPQGLAGQYYVFVRTDRQNDVGESNEANNSRADGIIFNLTPPADLIVSNVVSPPNGSPGEPITFNWTVQNTGDDPALGIWNDAIYLSSDQTWDINDVLIGKQSQIGPINGGQSYNGSLTLALPAINAGNYFVIVRADVRNSVRETNENNNTSAAISQTAIEVQELQIGVPQNTTLVTGQEKFYRTNAPADETVIFSVDGEADSSNELFTRFGQVASRNFYDFLYNHPNEPDQEVVVPNTQAGTYYNLVRGTSVPENLARPDIVSKNKTGNQEIETVTIKAEIVPFEIRQVSPSQAGNAGFSTLTVDGGKFQPNATVKLRSKTGVESLPLQTKVDKSQIAALFDLRQKPVGVYDLIVTNPDGATKTLLHGFNIISGGGHHVSVFVSSLESVRPNTYGRFTVSVRNSGTNDALLTPLFIFLPANADFRLSRDREIDPLTQVDLPVGINLEDLPVSIDTDNGKMIPLIIPLLRRGDTLDISIDVLAPSGANTISVRASLMPPMLTGDLTTSMALSQEDHATFCLLEALRQEVSRIILAFIPGGACAQAIADQISEALSIPNELVIRNATGERAGFSGWKSINKIILSFLYSTTVCAIDLSPLRVLKILKAVMIAFKNAWDAYEIGNLADECTKPPPKPEDYDHMTTSSIRSPIDPNDKTGPLGYGEQQFVNAQQDLLYLINFENVSGATAYAQRIRITDQLDPNLDWRTFRLKEIGFKQYRFQVPENRAFFQQRVQLGPDLDNLLADISAGVDITTGTVTWTLTAINPMTGEQPNGTNLGLLPPNNENNDGQGFITFTVKPKATATTGSLIKNKATITFDTELPINTNTVSNTLDAGLPVSQVAILPSTSEPEFTVSWNGIDPPNGAGVHSYSVFVSENGGAYQPFVTGTLNTGAQFTGARGKTYRFYSVARDNAGNVEEIPAVADAATTVLGGAFEADVAPRPNGNNNGTVTVTDLTQTGRFVAGLDIPDQPVATNEFQRADSAPRSINGDGALTVADITQAGRYVAGLDALQGIGGPLTMSLASPSKKAESGFRLSSTREIHPTRISRSGNKLVVAVELNTGSGKEAANAIGFTLNFDSSVLSNPTNINLGTGAGGATLISNNSQAAQGVSE
jgi:hypothetical protein